MSKSSKANWSDLAIRLVSALVMAALALAANWVGGFVFSVFWLLAATAVLAEWLILVERGEKYWPAIDVGAATLASATFLMHAGHWEGSLLAIISGSAVLALAALWRGIESPLLFAAAVPYASAVALPVIWLRQDDIYGPTSILVLFAIVWGSDIMAYFTGRTFGGPKLWPRISPKKTWSGFLGGVIFGGVGAGLVGGSMALTVVGAGLAAISQAGDLFESSIKRRFDAKDASHIIPGHGGVMDRLDGFLVAALVALVIGLVRAGGAPASGFLNW